MADNKAIPEQTQHDEHRLSKDSSSLPNKEADMSIDPTTSKSARLDAQAANQAEHDMTLKQALSMYRSAVFWSLLVSFSIIMEGYDTNLISNLYAYPRYRETFGEQIDGEWTLTGQWQTALGAGSMAGCFVGALFNGYLVKRLGFRWMFIIGLIMMTAFVFISVFGMTVELQVVGQTLCGLPWGIFATLGPAYASEILPLQLRPYLTSYTNMCFAIGQFVSAGVLRGTLDMPGNWSWRLPFALQWIYIPPLLIGAYFMPESPWWLIRANKFEEAEAVLKRTTSGEQREKAHQTVAMMTRTNEIEMEVEAGTSYWDCFKGVNLRRTEIACMAMAAQVLVGSEFAYSGTFFYDQIGLASEETYGLNLGGTAIAFVGTIVAWILIGNFGRRTIYMTGAFMLSIVLFIIGCLEYGSSGGAVWGQAVLCIVWLLIYSLSIGPIGWTIPVEVSSTRLRSKSMVLARNSYYVLNLIARVVQPQLINPTNLDLQGKTGYFWFAFAAATTIWTFFRLTETRGRTFEELDIMFIKKIPARKFAKYHVDAYDDEEDHGHA
ncbi:hypothetical protein MBLNU230_g5231t1 [Neophaeotheca triangularis]